MPRPLPVSVHAFLIALDRFSGSVSAGKLCSALLQTRCARAERALCLHGIRKLLLCGDCLLKRTDCDCKLSRRRLLIKCL